VAYVRDFEPLADALKRVLAATSVKEDEAKRDICHAIADKKIAVQVRVDTSDLSFGGRTYCRGNVAVPRHLNPDDFDWLQSRPLKPFSIVPLPGENYYWYASRQGRVIELIELSTADVTNLLCGAGIDGSTNTEGIVPATPGSAQHDATEPPSNVITLKKPPPTSKKALAAYEALTSKYPNGVPSSLETREAVTIVTAWMNKYRGNRYSFERVSSDVVARLLGRKSDTRRA
jgi:hypothetical protein